jgi:ANTAR domain/GAF domain
MGNEPERVPADPATANMFRTLSELVYAADDFEGVYDALVNAAVTLVEGCDHASLMLKRGSTFITVAASDDVARQIDSLENQIGEGPCLDAIQDETVYHDADLNDGSPWPNLAKRVLAETPVRGMAGFRLRADNEKNGALNLFSDSPGGLTATAVDQGIVLASFTTVALRAYNDRLTAKTLRDGLQSNREIGKAVGLLMAFHQISDDAAFDMLRKASQDMNIKLAEVARQVVDHHREA